MDPLDEINSLGQTSGLETKRLRDLPLHQPFPITHLQKTSTRYGKRIICTCDEFIVFLPTRFNTLTEGTIDSLNNRSLFLEYLGIQNGAYLVRFTEGVIG